MKNIHIDIPDYSQTHAYLVLERHIHIILGVLDGYKISLLAKLLVN